MRRTWGGASCRVAWLTTRRRASAAPRRARPDLARAFAELRRLLRPGGALTLGFSTAAKLREFEAITRHGFHFHEDRAIVAAAEGAGLSSVRLVQLHGRVTEGDRVLRASG